jgi:hypothetical protein
MKRAVVACVVSMLMALVLPAGAQALPDIPSERFSAAQGCGCHAGLLSQWRPSMHAKALSDPLFVLKLKEGDEATDGALGPFCNACHAPIAVMAGELSGTDQSRVSAVGAEGVTCDFCHQATGTSGALGNTSVAITGDGTKRAQLPDPMAPHPAAYSAFHETAEFCGNCHNVDHPGNGMHLEATYTEWKAGPYAAEGIVCQDCHMTPGPGVTKPNPGKAAGSGPDRPHIYTMTFAGGNVGLGDATLAEQRLKAAATLALEAPEIVESGDVALKTTITNVGAGHYLPTGLTEVRQMWLEVVATDADGTELLSERRDFGSVLKDAKGNAPVELWEAVDFASDDRIPPRQSTSNDYSFGMGTGPVTVTATLYYRSCSEEMATKAGVEIPTTTMASAEKKVYVSAAQKADTETSEARAEQTGDTDEGAGALVWVPVVVVVIIAAAVAYMLFTRRR